MSNVSIHQYKGTGIANSSKNTEMTPFEEARIKIQTNFEKGFIDRPTYDAANKQLDNLLQKAVGEGSKGGHVIGHTKSGKPIYAPGSNRPDAKKVQYHGEHELRDVASAHLKHHAEALKNDKSKFDSTFNNPDVKVLHISGKKPLSNQLKEHTGSSYNLDDFDETNDPMARVYTHKKTGKKFTSVNEEMAGHLGIKFNKAEEEGSDDLVKGGEGSKGGKVIGHTKSGKPIYDGKMANSAHYKDFSEEDHYDAFHAKQKHLQQNSHGKSTSEAFSAAGEAASHFTEGNKLTHRSVIGKTRSGKPISSNPKSHLHEDFTAEDHRDAANLHGHHSNDAYLSKKSAVKKEDYDAHAENHKKHADAIAHHKQQMMDKVGGDRGKFFGWHDGSEHESNEHAKKQFKASKKASKK